MPKQHTLNSDRVRPVAAQSAQISAHTLARPYPHYSAGPPLRCSFCQRPLSTFARLRPLGR